MVTNEEAERRKQYWRDLREDYREFLVQHKAEVGNKVRKFVPARLIPLPGGVLKDLEAKGFIESNGGFSYRPK